MLRRKVKVNECQQSAKLRQSLHWLDLPKLTVLANVPSVNLRQNEIVQAFNIRISALMDQC